MAGGLTIDGLNVRAADKRIKFDLFRGFFGREGVEYEGEDDDVQDATGMEAQPRRPIRRVLEFRGAVTGQGADLATRRADFRAAMEELYAVLDPTADPVAVVITGPYLGVPAGETRSLTARWSGDSWSDPDPDWARRRGVFQMVCVDSPPHWVAGP